MYKVHYNSCHDGCKITILEYILRKNLRIACIQKVCFLSNFEENHRVTPVRNDSFLANFEENHKVTPCPK